MDDCFVGTWTLNVARSAFDAHHGPPNGMMTVERDADGAYLMQAQATKSNGEALKERPQRLRPDNPPYPVPEL
jgi:hypothetical protein